jgi:outer membrane protein
MKKFNLFIFLTLFFININSLHSAEIKIAYLDLEKIMLKSKVGIKISKDLEKIFNKNLSNFNKIEKSLVNEEQEIIKQKNILTKEEFEKKILEFRIKIKKLNDDKIKAQREINTKKVVATGKFLKILNPLLSEFSSKNSIGLVIQKKYIVVGKSALDITDNVLKIVDNEVKSIKID